METNTKKRKILLLGKINKIFSGSDITIDDLIPLVGDLSKTFPNNIDYIDWWYSVGTDKYEIIIEYQPTNFKRGPYIAKSFCQPSYLISHTDGWPRYYFSLKNCLWECNEWLKRRKDSPFTRKEYTDPYEDY